MIDSIGTSTAASATTREKASLLKDDFLKLLVTQMENQDPLEPLDNTEFTAQLAQFTSLEQLFNINENLHSFEKMQATLNNTQALSYLGRDVRAEGNLFNLKDGLGTVSYTLSQPADEVFIGIYNASGDIVRSYSLINQDGGDTQLVWDGKDKNGVPLADGMYSFNIGASAGENMVQASTFIRGTVDGVSYDQDGNPVISVGGINVSSADIRTIK